MNVTPFKQFERCCLIGLLLAALASLVFCMIAIATGGHQAGRWCTTAGFLFTLAGLFQLEVSGFMSTLWAEYDDPEKYPFGPPSHIMRRGLIVDPDEPAILTEMDAIIFLRPRTAFWLVVTGAVLGLIGTWL